MMPLADISDGAALFLSVFFLSAVGLLVMTGVSVVLKLTKRSVPKSIVGLIAILAAIVAIGLVLIFGVPA